MPKPEYSEKFVGQEGVKKNLPDVLRWPGCAVPTFAVTADAVFRRANRASAPAQRNSPVTALVRRPGLV